MIDVLRLIGGNVGLLEVVAPEVVEEDGSGANGDDVAEGRGELRAADGCGEAGDLFASRVAAVAADDIGKGGSGHGRLLGGEGQTEDEHDHEADGVVGAYEKAFYEGRPLLPED